MNEIAIPWHNVQWNDLCSNVIEHFGLPGDRYTSHLTENNIKFIFKNEHDSFLCKILLSESL